MQKKQASIQDMSTEQKKYKSKFKEGFVTEAAYITEIIFEKRHEIFNQGRCPESFWNSDSYKKQFTGQIIQANKLLKKYSGHSIISAINSPKSKGVIKLQDKRLIPIIEDFEKNKKDKEIVISENNIIQPSKPFGAKKNLLREL